MKRLTIISVTTVAAIAALGFVPRHHWAIGWQLATASLASPPAPAAEPFIEPTPWAKRLVGAANQQIGVTVSYDPAYARLEFPGGDVPRERGVCTDVVIRALRDAHGIDLQHLVNRDMKSAFGSYPARWGLKRPDSNIDHRRVPNLRRYFERKGLSLPVSDKATDYLPGDLVTWKLPGNLDHIGIVTDYPTRDGQRPLIVHNIGAGTRLQDLLFSFEITGHYRLDPSPSPNEQ